jgi:hypothetical protein
MIMLIVVCMNDNYADCSVHGNCSADCSVHGNCSVDDEHCAYRTSVANSKCWL